MFEEINEIMWTHNGCLEPLYDIEDFGDRFIVTFDLPCVDKENINLYVTEDTIKLDASMKRTLCWEKWGTIQRKIIFKQFKKQVKLPERVNPEKATAIFKKGILQIDLPKFEKKHLSIKI
ncbi:MAG TPA: Hsp20/alpha crystallin family protein [Halobacteria archaeon]|nr:Hsp20/alpha crystallin family protein [Halobacteria archaeon]